LVLKKYSFSYPPRAQKNQQWTNVAVFVLAIMKMQDDPKLELADVVVEEGNKRNWLAVDLHRAREKPKPLRKQQLTCGVVYGKFIRWCLE
jgi:hypothetical protein